MDAGFTTNVNVSQHDMFFAFIDFNTVWRKGNDIKILKVVYLANA